jgi:hypothetical protein
MSAGRHSLTLPGAFIRGWTVALFVSGADLIPNLVGWHWSKPFAAEIWYASVTCATSAILVQLFHRAQYSLKLLWIASATGVVCSSLQPGNDFVSWLIRPLLAPEAAFILILAAIGSYAGVFLRSQAWDKPFAYSICLAIAIPSSGWVINSVSSGNWPLRSRGDLIEFAQGILLALHSLAVLPLGAIESAALRSCEATSRTLLPSKCFVRVAIVFALVTATFVLQSCASIVVRDPRRTFHQASDCGQCFGNWP